MEIRKQRRFTRVDFVALLVFVAVWIYYFFMVRNGFYYPSECFYVTVVDRFVRGDRPLVDEWARTQLAFLPLYLPYKLYITLNGSTAGVFLFMRYLFLAFNAVFYWCMYIQLRIYGWLDLIATLLFCMYVPYGFFSCNYYTIAVRLIMLVSLILFSGKQKRLSLFFAGILLSCAVLNQPGLAFLFFSYSVFVWVRFFMMKRSRHFLDNYAFCINVFSWKYLSVGVLSSTLFFLAWLLTRSGLHDILTTIPYMIYTDPEYDISVHGNMFIVFFKKIREALHLFGPLCWISSLVIITLSVFYAFKIFRAQQFFSRKILFCFACAIWMLSCRPTFRILTYTPRNIFSFMCPVPLFLFGLTCFLLCEQKNKRFFFFWLVGFFSSLCVDFFSNATLLLGCPIAYIADLVFFAELVQELRAEPTAKKITSVARLRERNKTQKINTAFRWSLRLTCFCFAAWFAFTFLWENTAFWDHTRYNASFFSLPILCEEGPARSIRRSEVYGNDYTKKLADIDTLKAQYPRNLYICGLAPELYLYADLPYACLTSYASRETKYVNRQILYWKLHPERLPDCIYFPIDDFYNPIHSVQEFLDWVHDSFDPVCKYTMEEGQCGYILYVTQWKL